MLALGFFLGKYLMSSFYTPPGCAGTAELTASTGLAVVEQGRWTFSQSGYNDGATFGVSIGGPVSARNYDYGADTRGAETYYSTTYQAPPPSQGQPAGLLHLRAINWTIAVIGNQLTDYDDPETSAILPANRCRIELRGRWEVQRGINSNSWNGFVVEHTGTTLTDQGGRDMDPWLLDYESAWQTYVIQGSAVTGGAQDTFSSHEFWVKITESARSPNSNREFQTNTIARPVWRYSYSKSWQI